MKIIIYYFIIIILIIVIAYNNNPLYESFTIPIPDRRITLSSTAINYRIVAFNPYLPNILRIVNVLGAKVIPAKIPTAKDDNRLSAYGKYLRFYCNGRHTESHYNYAGALGIAIVSIDLLWKECAQTNIPSVIFEENTHVLNFTELLKCIAFCMHNNIDFMQIHTSVNGTQNYSHSNFFGGDNNRDKCPFAQRNKKQNKGIRISKIGIVYPLNYVYTSAKCYYISPRFAKHMCAVTNNYIENLHIDVWLCMEALFPSGVDHTHKPFISYVYHGNPVCVVMLNKKKAGITSAILHTPPIK